MEAGHLNGRGNMILYSAVSICYSDSDSFLVVSSPLNSRWSKCNFIPTCFKGHLSFRNYVIMRCAYIMIVRTYSVEQIYIVLLNKAVVLRFHHSRQMSIFYVIHNLSLLYSCASVRV